MEGTSLMTLKGMNVMVGSVAQESRQVQVLLCLLLAMRSWASHFPLRLSVFTCKMGIPTGLIVLKKRKSCPN